MAQCQGTAANGKCFRPLHRCRACNSTGCLGADCDSRGFEGRKCLHCGAFERVPFRPGGGTTTSQARTRASKDDLGLVPNLLILAFYLALFPFWLLWKAWERATCLGVSLLVAYLVIGAGVYVHYDREQRNAVPLEVRWHWGKHGAHLVAAGQVKNRSSHPLGKLRLVATFAGRHLPRLTGAALLSALGPGSHQVIDVEVPYKKGYASCELAFKMGNAVVPFVAAK